MTRDRILQIYRGTTAQNDAFTGAQGELTMDTARKEIRIHDGSTAGGNVVGLTPGFIAPFAGSTAPAGWLVCDGSAVSRTIYAKLFAVIGTTYGEGDGNSTFNLPDKSKVHIAGVPDLPNYIEIPKTNLSTTNTTFTVNSDGLLRVLLTQYGGALEEFMIDDILMTALINAFTSYQGFAVGFIPIRKGTHTMRTSSSPSRCVNLLFWPYKDTEIAEIQAIKY